MKRKNCLLSTIAPDASQLARQYGLGLEIAEFCTAYRMDVHFPETDAALDHTLSGVSERILHGPFNELFPCAIDPKARELARSRYRQAVTMAREYGIDRIVIHGGYHPWIYYPVWYTEQSIPFWRDFLGELPMDMEILLENVLEEQPQMLLDIIRSVGDPRLRMCLDIGHANVYSKVSAEEWLETCAPWIGHFHIHNNDGSWDTHSPLEQGTIPVQKLLARAEVLCPDATYTLELMDSETSIRFLLEEQ